MRGIIKNGDHIFLLKREDTEMVSCKKDGLIYLHAEKFDDRKGIHVCNKWYSSISIKENHESVIENKKALQIKQYEHCLGFPKKINGEHLYLILNSNW